jgi:DNA polymerase-3 subunit delta
MSPEEALREARAGELRPLYLLVGDEAHFVDQVVRALREATVAGGIPGLNEDQLMAGEVDVDAVLSAARTLPMMAKRRWVLVRGLEKWESDKGDKRGSALDRLADYAENPANTTVLVLVGPALDKRRKLANLGRKHGWLVSCETPKRAELPRWIEARAKERGNRISYSVADLLAELAGPELGPLADALERVALYVGEGQEITEAAVAECVVRVRSATVWELVGAVGRRDVASALRFLDDVFDPQDRGLRLLGVLAWATRQLVRFESAMRNGDRPDEAAKAAGAPPFKARELADQVRAVPRPVLESWLERLSEVDLALKGGSKRPPKAILEQALIDLCRAS